MNHKLSPNEPQSPNGTAMHNVETETSLAEHGDFTFPEHELDITPVKQPHARGMVGRILAQGSYETKITLSNGEQLLVAIILPFMVLSALVFTDFLAEPGGPSTINLATPGVLALAVLSAGLTGQGIATGFDRRYGVLRYLSTTPLGPAGLLLGKTVAVLLVLVVQFMVLGMSAVVMGWLPNAAGVLYGIVFMFVGALTFTALGLLIAGTVRPEATLAITNILWVVLGATGGVVFSVGDVWFSPFLQFLPSAALGEGMRAAMTHGEFDLVSLAVLVVWGLIFSVSTVRWFKWR